MSKAHNSHARKKDKRIICESCDLRTRCNFYLNKSYRFSYGDLSTHTANIEDSYEERALLCCHRQRIFDRQGIKQSFI